MTKATRREPARTATPEELAEENRRAEEARLPKPDAETLAAFRSLLAARGDTELLLAIKNGEWLPTQPHEVAAALVVLLDDSEEDCATLEALRKRVEALEARLDPEATYTFDSDDEDDVPIETLWTATHNSDGTRRAKGPAMGNGEVIDDLMTGALRPKTWAQLCDALEVLGEYHVQRIKDVMNIEDGRRPLAELVANLHRAIMAPSGRTAADIADTFVLEVESGLIADREDERADEVAHAWDLIKTYRTGDWKAIAEFKKHWRLVSYDIHGEPIEVDA